MVLSRRWVLPLSFFGLVLLSLGGLAFYYRYSLGWEQGEWVEIQHRYFESKKELAFGRIYPRRSPSAIEGADVERCTTCHLGIADSHPRRELLPPHPLEKIGCVGCHGGNGNSLSRPVAHESLIPKTLREGRCQSCHRETEYVPRAERQVAATQLVRNLNCQGCHAISLDGVREAPSLTRVKSKLSRPWIERWLQDPAAYNPHHRMPRFEFEQSSDAAALASFLLFQSETVAIERVPVGGRVDKGRALFQSIGCLGCHGLEGMKQTRFGVAPDLSRIGSKVTAEWLFDWLKEPTHYSPKTRMPSFRLTDVEAGHLTAFLLSQREKLSHTIHPDKTTPAQGLELVEKHGCFGCHEIRGFENRVPLWPAVWPADGKFHTQRGPKYDLGEAERELVHLRWMALDAVKVKPQWQAKLSPVRQRVENMAKVMHRYQCLACHVAERLHVPLPEEHPDFMKHEEARFQLEGRIHTLYTDDETLGPPPIIDEGKRVFSEWAREFVSEPSPPLRTALTVRMPTFPLTAPELDAVVEGWKAQAEPLTASENPAMTLSPERLTQAQDLFARMQCLGCHGDVNQVATAGGAQGFAPQFHHARGRLRREWIVEWLRDPQKFQPGTRMPGFWPDGISPIPEILNGDAESQIQLLSDYLISTNAEFPEK